jgi:hypothetical protein
MGLGEEDAIATLPKQELWMKKGVPKQELGNERMAASL